MGKLEYRAVANFLAPCESEIRFDRNRHDRFSEEKGRHGGYSEVNQTRHTTREMRPAGHEETKKKGIFDIFLLSAFRTRMAWPPCAMASDGETLRGAACEADYVVGASVLLPVRLSA
jgi:hypothetical protein